MTRSWLTELRNCRNKIVIDVFVSFLIRWEIIKCRPIRQKHVSLFSQLRVIRSSRDYSTTPLESVLARTAGSVSKGVRDKFVSAAISGN